MSKRSSNGLRALQALVACLSLAATAAYAQSTATNEVPVKLEKFVVTGSNIPTTEVAGEARTFPVQTIDRRAIDASGVFSTTELLQKMTLSNGGSVPLSNNATGFTPGGTSTSLRGLGPDTTLVLINGRRVAPYPVGTGGTTAFVDLNTIPLAAIERVEVLKDGASATYGADAVAGVVNIILRRNFDGAVATLNYGNTTNRDSSDFSANFIYGIKSDSGSLTLGANYQQRQAIFNRDREYSAVPAFLSSNSSPANFQVSRAAVEQALGLAPGGNIPGIAAGTQVFFASTFAVKDTNNGNVPANQYTYSDGRTSTFNFNEFSGSYPQINRRGMFASWERDFYGKNAQFYGDAFYQDVTQYDELAPYATGNFVTPGQTTIVIPSRTPNPILTPAEIAAGTGRTATAGAFNPFNPFNMDISGSSRIRFAEFGNRVYQTHNVAFAATGGLRIENVADKYTLDGKVRFSQIENNANNRLISTGRLLRAMNAADPIFNPASPSYIGSTVPYNPFGYFRNEIATNSAPVNFATHYQRDFNASRLVDAGVSLTSGDLMELSAGSVGFALGADYRRESIDQRPDSALQAGEILAATPASPIARQRKVASYFTEFEVPVFSEKSSVSYARKLSLNLAGRYETFLTSDRSTFVPKVGLRWVPMDDNLVFRASWGKGFREPSLYELYAPPVSALTPINDPVSGVNEPEQPITLKGNPLLDPEDSKSVNLGVVWTPKGSMDGFTFSLDFWRIERSGTVTSNPQDTLDRSLVNQLIPGESIVRDFANNLVQVNSVFQNLGATEVQGFDIATSYLWKTESLGRFEAGVNATYMDSYKLASTAGAEMVEIIETEVPGATSDDAYLKWKAQAWVGWNFTGINTRLTGTYTGGFNELDINSEPRRVSSTIFYDLQLSYSFFPSKGDPKVWSDLKVTVGVDNLFDKAPPHAEGEGGNSNGYPGFLYTDVGRFVYVSLEKKL